MFSGHNVPMTDLATATARLERAIGRLEDAARNRLATVTGDRKRLGAEVARAKADLAQLETVTDGVSNRLDGAIERLRNVLNG
jgi:multidrug resistance efflux pump